MKPVRGAKTFKACIMLHTLVFRSQYVRTTCLVGENLMVQKNQKTYGGRNETFSVPSISTVNYNQVKYSICIESKIEFGVNKDVMLYFVHAIIQ